PRSGARDRTIRGNVGDYHGRLPHRRGCDKPAANEGGGAFLTLRGAVWTKSTRSGQGDCVEVATNLPNIVAIRDSKHKNGPALVFSREDWKGFLAGLPSASPLGD